MTWLAGNGWWLGLLAVGAVLACSAIGGYRQERAEALRAAKRRHPARGRRAARLSRAEMREWQRISEPLEREFAEKGGRL